MMRLVIVWLSVVLFFPHAGAHAEPALRHTIILKVDPVKATVHFTDTVASSGLPPKVEVAPWLDVQSAPNGANGVTITANGTLPADNGNIAFAKNGWIYLPGPSWAPYLGGDASYRVTVEVPAPFRAIVTGRLENEELSSDVNRATFIIENATELPSVFIGPYIVSERISGGVRLRTYFTQNTAQHAAAYLDAADGYIKRFSAEIGPYPFADFNMIAAPLPVGLAFPGLTYIDERILPLPFIRERSLGHEVLHNWWGNGVIPDYERGNWSEGLTTYMADHALAATRSAQDALNMRVSWLRDYAALPQDKDTPVTKFVSKTHDASQIVGYGKTAYIFHMLKNEVGDERFNAAIRRFWKDYRGRIAGWNDIRKVFEAETGTDLGWFFDQWLNRTGAPTLSLSDVQIIPMARGYRVTIKVKQSTPTWRLNVPVDVIASKGTKRINIPLSGEQQTEQIDVYEQFISVHVDHDYTLFRRLLPGEAPPILRDVLLANEAQIYITGTDPILATAAKKLLQTLGVPPHPVGMDCTLIDPQPKCTFPGKDYAPGALILIGSRDAVDTFIERVGLPSRPTNVNFGTSRVWTAAREGAGPVLIIETDKAAPFEMARALDNLAQRLPHYRSKSFVVFDKQRAIANGVWPPNPIPMSTLSK